MDTMFSVQQNENSSLVGIFAGISIITTLICFQGLSIHASDIYIAKKSVQPLNLDTGQVKEKIFSEISPEVRKKQFDESVRQKYPKAIITDVTGGVKHIKLTKYYAGKPVRINLVEMDSKLADNLVLRPALSSSQTLKSRKTISSIAKNTNAIVALNGTYFKPQSGVPLGTLMIDETMYTGPIYDRVALGIFDDGFDVARVQLNASVKTRSLNIKIDNINQVQVLSDIGLTFSHTLRSILRQDPDIIMVGEIRDNETARIAVRASITGHLVLSTVHTNNSLTTIERLLDMEVERYLLGSALTGIVSQKLVKKLCPKCRGTRPTTPY